MRGALALLFALPILLGPDPVSAQDVPTLDELELAYSAAKHAHESARAAWEAQARRVDRAMETARAAREAGDEARVNEAYAAAQRELNEKERWNREVARTKKDLDAAREPYLRALGDRLHELEAELETTPDPGERRDVEALLAASNNLYGALLQESLQEETPLELQDLERINIQTTDTPREILGKADLLDHRADEKEAELRLTEEWLQRLRDQQRRTRTISDFVADAQRYDDTRPPVVAPGARTTDPSDPGQILPPGADTLGTEDRPLSLEEQIELLQARRDSLEEYITRARDRAQIFRRRAGGGREWA